MGGTVVAYRTRDDDFAGSRVWCRLQNHLNRTALRNARIRSRYAAEDRTTDQHDSGGPNRRHKPTFTFPAAVHIRAHRRHARGHRTHNHDMHTPPNLIDVGTEKLQMLQTPVNVNRVINATQ